MKRPKTPHVPIVRRRRDPSADAPKVLKSGTITLPPGSIPSPSGGKSSAFDFSQALMRGDPVALQALENATHEKPGIIDPASFGFHIPDPGPNPNRPRWVRPDGVIDVDKLLEDHPMPKDEPEPSLADEFIASTYTMGKALHLSGRPLKEFDVSMMRYRDDMRKAHRFVLDDEFTRFASELSSKCTAEKLLTRLEFATLPYETTWIEFDLWVKLRVMRTWHGLDPEGFNKDDTSQKMGMLVHRINETDALCEIVNRWGNGIVGPNLLAYLFSTREREWGETRYFGSMPMSVIAHKAMTGEGFRAANELGISIEEQQRLGKLGTRLGGSMWGFTEKGQSTFIRDVSELSKIKTPEFLLRHGDAAFSRMYYALDDGLRKAGYETETMDTTVQIELAEFTGMMRWLVIVLAMLNEVPTRSDYVQPSHQMKAGLTKRIRAVDYHRLTLRLPKTKPVPYLERKISGVEHHRKAHEVRAHWRTYLHDEHCSFDDHLWEYDNDNGYALCGRCMAFRRRIREHVRGDPNLGWVRKDYVIKRSEQE